MNNYKSILAVIVTLVTLGGVIIAMEQHYAKASDVQQIECSLNLYILSQRADQLQQRIWTIEDRYQNKEMPQEVKDSYRKAVEERRQILKEIEIIKSKSN